MYMVAPSYAAYVNRWQSTVQASTAEILFFESMLGSGQCGKTSRFMRRLSRPAVVAGIVCYRACLWKLELGHVLPLCLQGMRLASCAAGIVFAAANLNPCGIP